MRIPYCNGLRYEILGNLTVVLLFALLLTGLGVWFINGRQMIQDRVLQGHAIFLSLGEELLSNGTAGAWVGSLSNRNHLKEMQSVITRYHQRNPLLHLFLVDERSRLLACSGMCPEGSTLIQDRTISRALSQRKLCSELQGTQGLLGLPDRVKIAVPLVKEGRIIGGVLGHFSLTDVVASARRTQKFVLIYMGLGTIVLLGFGTILLSRTIVHPLERISSVIDRMAGGEINEAVPVSSRNEIGRLAEAFNKMAHSLRQHQRVLQDHVKALQRVNTELKHSQEEVIHSEKLASIGLLAAGVAHEVGNPLSSVLGYVGILQQGVDDTAERKDYLARIEKEILRIHTIVKELREYSRPSSLQRKSCEVNAVIHNTIRMIANQGDFKEVRIETDLEPHVPRLTLDENQFQQVLVNLFLNAKDAMHGNGVLSVRSKSTVYEVPPEIMPKEAPRRRDDPPNIDFQLLRSAPSPSRERFILGQPLVEIDIVDHGEGIPHEHLSKVFNPFFTTKGTGRGTGLGLAISQRIIESFHGDITIESEPGKGCTVRILLPAEETKRSGEEDSGETKRTDH